MRQQYVKPLHPGVLSVICQIWAIAENVAGSASDLKRFKLIAITRALEKTLRDIEDRIAWLECPGTGRVA